jgi:hypothetical protein
MKQKKIKLNLLIVLYSIQIKKPLLKNTYRIKMIKNKTLHLFYYK